MGEIRSYRDLIVWQKAMDLAKQVYVLSKTFPADERFGLTQQLRRSIVSVPSNIAEGSGRGTTGDYLRFLHIARGSLFEAQTQLDLAEQLGFSSKTDLQRILPLCNETERMLNALITKLTD
jgi:four helix bundle protein